MAIFIIVHRTLYIIAFEINKVFNIFDCSLN